MEIPTTVIEELYKRVEAYSKTTIELAKLKAIETTSVVVSALIWRLSVIITIFIFILVLNIGIALWLGELLGKSYYGFFIVAGFYLFGGLILHFFLRKWIKKTMSNFIINQTLQ
ncbi:MAG: phage holin family protein [Saprospiraceae bacterium]